MHCAHDLYLFKKKSLYILNRYCLNLLKSQEILDLFQGPDQMSPLLSLLHLLALCFSDTLYSSPLGCEHIYIIGNYSCAPSSFVNFFRAQISHVRYYSNWKLFVQLMTPKSRNYLQRVEVQGWVHAKIKTQMPLQIFHFGLYIFIVLILKRVFTECFQTFRPQNSIYNVCF